MTTLATRVVRLEQERPTPLLTAWPDPLAFAAAAGFDRLDPWQADILTAPAPRVLLNVTRQGGKSSVAALLAVHRIVTQPGALVLVLSPSLRQSGELFKRAASIYQAVGRPVPAVSETALTLTLANGGRLVSLPGRTDTTIRGYSGVALLIVDEAARVPDDLYLACRPMLAVSGGRLLALSTPFGTRGWFYGAWTGTEPWKRVEVPATACRRISPAFLAEEERTLGAWWFVQEYCCQFLDSQSQAFTRADIDAAFSEEVEAWDFSTQYLAG
jgi:hypothetical protein